MKTIKDVSISNKRVFFRVDFNVPLDENRRITDDSRIRSVLPTLKYALEEGAKLILASHLGRPKGSVRPEMSLTPAAERLGRLLESKVRMAGECIGADVRANVSEMKNGDILLLENLRFHPEEEKNDDGFAKALADLCDVYVNDAFAVSHRVNASIVAITKFAPASVAGLLLHRELDYFKRAMADPERPLVAVIGGSKVSGKISALENMLNHVDRLIIGGAMANTFLKSKGIDVGKSLVEADYLGVARAVMKKASENNIELYLPVDAVVATRMDPDAEAKVVAVDRIPSDCMALDIGPATSKRYATALEDAKTIVWNGPMGVFEMDAFSRGTIDMARHLAKSEALTIVGGGDTDAAVHKAGEIAGISYISTGGGAFLALLEGKVLPGVAALEAAEEKER